MAIEKEKDTLRELQELLRDFTRERDWDQFHNGKDLAIALSIEASELLEPFLWKTPEEASREKIAEELAGGEERTSTDKNGR